MNPPKQDYRLTVERVDSDETILAVIKKHPFGLIKLYIQSFIGLAALVAIALYVTPSLVPREENPEIYSLLAAVALVVLVIVGLVLLVATVIYLQSKIVLTDQTITQTLQLSLFNRKISQLAVSSIEDVTAHKAGIFPTMLDYGKLLVETAGEQENFHFDYCPKPDHYAKLILESRQQFMSRREFEMREQRVAFANASYSQPDMPPQYYQQPPQQYQQYPPQPQQQQPQNPTTPPEQRYYTPPPNVINNQTYSSNPNPNPGSNPGTDYRGPA